MNSQPEAILVAEIGSATTRVTLLDTVDGETRFIAQADAPSTVELPYENAVAGVLEAARQLSEICGRRLLVDSNLLMPQTAERDGVDAVMFVTSATLPLQVVVAAVSYDLSGVSAQRACQAIYSHVVHVLTPSASGKREVAVTDSWLEQQLRTILGVRPDVVVLAGGLEDGATDALVRLAALVGQAAVVWQSDPRPGSSPERAVAPVIFAGNSKGQERVLATLSDKVPTVVAENVRPQLHVERLASVRRELARLYAERMLPTLPGIHLMRRLTRDPLRLVNEAHGLMARFVSERYGRQLLLVDVGATNTAIYYAGNQAMVPTISTGLGVGYGASELVATVGAAQISRWLPYGISDRELLHWAINTTLRPLQPPTQREDLLLVHGLVREAVSHTLATLQAELPDLSYDLVFATGMVFQRAPHPGLAVLSLLDALQPRAERSVLAVDIHLDSLGLLSVCGAIAQSNPDAAVTLFERDLLQNTPLATCVVALGEGKAGELALEAELHVSGGVKQTLKVNHGQLLRLPLAPGRRGQLTLRPAPGVRIGRNAPGEAVSSEITAIRGSVLGVVIDARGRPFHLPDTHSQRQQLLWEWLVGLGIEQGPLAYPVITSQQADQPVVLPPINETETKPATSVAATSLAAESGSIDNDLAKLRQTVNDDKPKRRGLFSRK